MWLTPTEEELFKRYNPDLQKRSLERREQTQQEFDQYVGKLKELSKSNKPRQPRDVKRIRRIELTALYTELSHRKPRVPFNSIWPTFRNASRSSALLRGLGTSLGKGTPRRTQKRGVAGRSAGDDKKLQASLKKLNVQPIQAIEEVNMFKSDGNVIHFAAPKVHAAVPANTFAVYGNGEDKELTELVPGILNQLGPDSLASLRKLAESYQNMQKGEKDGDEDDIPDLVEGENFESKVE
ncbi:Nascent polypeptide-associated complex subunit beta like protein [Verticillium longisporum]|nr:Nascent polypeptide-associated complex subunit beta like protein [Verticillium longisporum]